MQDTVQYLSVAGVTLIGYGRSRYRNRRPTYPELSFCSKAYNLPRLLRDLEVARANYWAPGDVLRLAIDAARVGR
jgi:hypothetical protein